VEGRVSVPCGGAGGRPPRAFPSLPLLLKKGCSRSPTPRVVAEPGGAVNPQWVGRCAPLTASWARLSAGRRALPHPPLLEEPRGQSTIRRSAMTHGQPCSTSPASATAGDCAMIGRPPGTARQSRICGVDPPSWGFSPRHRGAPPEGGYTLAPARRLAPHASSASMRSRRSSCPPVVDVERLLKAAVRTSTGSTHGSRGADAMQQLLDLGADTELVRSQPSIPRPTTSGVAGGRRACRPGT